MINFDQVQPIWSSFIKFKSIGSILNILIQFDQFGSRLNKFDLFWSILIKFDPFWTCLNKIDQFWSSLNQFDSLWTFWSNLIKFKPSWSNLIKFDHDQGRPNYTKKEQYKDWGLENNTNLNPFFYLTKSSEIDFFTCILPDYMAHSIPKEFWENRDLENMTADFLRGVKIYFGELLLKWCISSHGKNDSHK